MRPAPTPSPLLALAIALAPGLAAAGPGALALTSPAFADGEPIPVAHTKDGADRSPALAWSDPPADTRSFALIVDDPDAPTPEPFVHWLAWDLPADATGLPGGVSQGEEVPGGGWLRGGGLQGQNGFFELGYRGPSPPRGSGPHRYRFTLHALDVKRLGPEAGATRADLERAMTGRVLAKTTLVGTYERAAAEP